MGTFKIRKIDIPAAGRNIDYKYKGGSTSSSVFSSSNSSGSWLDKYFTLNSETGDLSISKPLKDYYTKESVNTELEKKVDTSLFDSLFELKTDSNGKQYIQAKHSLISVGEITAFSTDDVNVPSIFDSLSKASKTSHGIVQVGNGINVSDGVISIDQNALTPQELSLSGNILSISGSSNTVDLGNIMPDLSSYATVKWVEDEFMLKFTAKTAFNKDFGTASGTVAQGNDSRILNGQTAFGWGNHASAGYQINISAGTTSQYFRGDKTWQTLNTSAVAEGTNKYFTSARAVSAITGGASTIATSNLTVSRALVSNSSGKVAVSTVTSTELSHIKGVTSSVQTQLNSKLATTAFNNLFELVTPTTGDPYIQAKYSVASVGELVAYTSGGTIPSVFDAIPIATTTNRGLVQIGSGLKIAGGVVSIDGDTFNLTNYYTRGEANGLFDAKLNASTFNARTITAGNGLTGGGALSANRTVTLGTPSDITNDTLNTVSSTSHTHAIYINKVLSQGTLDAETGRSSRGNLYTYRMITNNSGHPNGSGYGSVINWGHGTSGSVQLYGGWTSGGRGRLWTRSLRDVTDNWTDWSGIYSDDYHPDSDKLGGVNASDWVRRTVAQTITGTHTYNAGINVPNANGTSNNIRFGNNQMISSNGGNFTLYSNRSSGVFEVRSHSNSADYRTDLSLDAGGDLAVSNGKITANNFIATTTSGDALYLNGVNNDVNIWRVDGGSAYGFYERYRGTGSGNDNALDLYSNNQTGTDILVRTVLQDGNVTFHKNVNVVGNLTKSGTKVALQNVSINAGNGLTGGGAISASRTITLGTPSQITNDTSNAVYGESHTHYISFNDSSEVAGNVSDSSLWGNGIRISSIGNGNSTYPAGYGTLLTVKHSSQRMFQFLHSHTNNGLWHRPLYGTQSVSWKRIYNDDYHPNSDKLGGVAASDYVRKTATNTLAGTYIFDSDSSPNSRFKFIRTNYGGAGNYNINLGHGEFHIESESQTDYTGFVMDSSNRFGMGRRPETSFRLSVNGSGRFYGDLTTNSIRLRNSGGIGVIENTGNQATYIYGGSANNTQNLILGSGNTNRIGVFTTVPQADVHINKGVLISGKLDIRPATNAWGNYLNIISSTDATKYTSIINDAAGLKLRNFGGGHTYFRRSADNSTLFFINDSTGNVAIGGENATERLHVVGNGLFTGAVTAGGATINGALNVNANNVTLSSSFTSSPNGNIRFLKTGTNTTGGGSYIQFDTSASATHRGQYNARIEGVRSAKANGSSQLDFYTSDGTSNALRMRIEDGGLVRAYGNISADGNITAPRFIGVADDSSKLGGISATYYARKNIAQTISAKFTFTGGLDVNNNSVTWRNAAGAGVGSINTQTNYHGKVGLLISSNFPNSSGVIGFQTIAGYNKPTIMDEQGHWTMSGNITAKGEVTAYQSSDKRLKSNITPITSSLSIIDKLTPVSFNWNYKAVELNNTKNTSSKNYGVIAQELEEVLPDLVHETNGFKSVDYIQLIGVLLAGMRELKQEVEQLKINSYGITK